MIADRDRAIVISVNTTGEELNTDHIVELSAVEMQNKKVSGMCFQVFLQPRTSFTVGQTKFSTSMYSKFYAGAFEEDKQCLLNFTDFLGSSLLFVFNERDAYFLNKELSFHNIREIPLASFTSLSTLFPDILRQIYPNIKSSVSLYEAKDFFAIPNQDTNCLETAFSSARVLTRLFEFQFDKSNVFRSKKISPALMTYISQSPKATMTMSDLIASAAKNSKPTKIPKTVKMRESLDINNLEGLDDI